MPTTSATTTEPGASAGRPGDEQQPLVAARLDASRLAEAVEVAALGHEAELDPGALQLGEHHVRVVVGEERPRQVDLDVVGTTPASIAAASWSRSGRPTRRPRPRRRPPRRPGSAARRRRAARPRRRPASSARRCPATRRGRGSTTTGSEHAPATTAIDTKAATRPHPVVVLRHEAERRDRDRRRGDQPGDEGDDVRRSRRRDGRRPRSPAEHGDAAGEQQPHR